MSKVAIFISDLHLGTGDELEDFSKENETAFVRFLKDQSAKQQGEDVDLVILGDFLDIWQVATDQEKSAEKSKAITLDIDENLEGSRITQIALAHPKTFDSLNEFLMVDPARRRLVCVTGNHDHSLVHLNLQQGIREAIVGTNQDLKDRISFPHFYDAPELRTYAEHGSQFDANNKYDDFATFGPECPGFYFVRLFWNRMEPKELDVDIWWNIFRVIWERRLWSLLHTAFKLFRQYRGDPRDFKRIDLPGVPYFDAKLGPVPAPVTGKSLPECPDILFSDSADPKRIFSSDLATENRLRVLYHDPQNTEFRVEVDRILIEKYRGQVPPIPSGLLPPAPAFGLLVDDYVKGVSGMFADPGEPPRKRPMKVEALSKAKYDYVLFGHTHEPKSATIEKADVLYFNTGSWTMVRDLSGKNVSRLCYVTIRKSSDGSMSAVQDYWDIA
jgi:UDP-2,3-diacylglucosamine pyrophosphatase LpxH